MLRICQRRIECSRETTNHCSAFAFENSGSCHIRPWSGRADVTRWFFLEQQFRRLHSRVAVKPALHHFFVQEICN